MRIFLSGVIIFGSSQLHATERPKPVKDLFELAQSCQTLGKRLETCLPHPELQASAGELLAYRIIIRCDELKTPLRACDHFYHTAIQLQSEQMCLDRNLGHSDLSSLEELRDLLIREQAQGLDIRSDLEKKETQ